jgi:CAAX prenyl protease-like protein
MGGLLKRLRDSPLWCRVAPFLIFVSLTTMQGLFGEEWKYWIYTGKSVVGAVLLSLVWPNVKELRWTISLEAVVVGVLVIVVWVGIDPFYPKLLHPDKPWNPNAQFGEGSGVAWFLMIGRILGSSLVVPGMEEMFYRSFLYRYIIRPDFEDVSLTRFHATSFVVTSTLFGFAHREWLAGIFCGLAYQWLVLRKGHLGDAMTAHAISNLLLGIWVMYKGAWLFW